jgi:hypothetical protein
VRIRLRNMKNLDMNLKCMNDYNCLICIIYACALSSRYFLWNRIFAFKKKHGYLGIMCADPAPQHEEFRYENLIQRIVQFSVCLESNKEL